MKYTVEFDIKDFEFWSGGRILLMGMFARIDYQNLNRWLKIDFTWPLQQRQKSMTLYGLMTE